MKETDPGDADRSQNTGENEEDKGGGAQSGTPVSLPESEGVTAVSGIRYPSGNIALSPGGGTVQKEVKFGEGIRKDGTFQIGLSPDLSIGCHGSLYHTQNTAKWFIRREEDHTRIHHLCFLVEYHCKRYFDKGIKTCKFVQIEVPMKGILAELRTFCLGMLVLGLLAGLVSSCKFHSIITDNKEDIPSYLQLFDKYAVLKSLTGETDTLWFEKPLERIVCMSSSHVAFLDALGCDSLIVGVSGIGYHTSPQLQERYARGEVFDIGYEAAPDYERLVALHPDLVTTYTVSSAVPPYITKLNSLGIRVLILNEHLEQSPLARASYLKLFGALTNRRAKADSLYAMIAGNYNRLRDEVADTRSGEPRKVLMNIPYADRWYIPGGENYMARLVRDAGGEVLGAEPGRSESSVISLEKAWELSSGADLWLDVGNCRTVDQLRSQVPLLKDSPLLLPGKVYNNNRRATPAGGNDFWESGAVRPDLILRDLCSILRGAPDSLYFYQELE